MDSIGSVTGLKTSSLIYPIIKLVDTPFLDALPTIVSAMHRPERNTSIYTMMFEFISTMI